MIHSFTPSGVEHMSDASDHLAAAKVIHSFTPSGVEHSITAKQHREKRASDSFVYAVRR